MPYAVRKSGDKYKVVNKNTGRVYGTHDSKEKANRQLAALHIHTHESKSILKQDLIIECDGAITIVPEGSVIFVDRYSALGMESPDPETMCKGECEGTGFIPVFNPEFTDNGKCRPVDDAPLIDPLLSLWNAAEQVSPTDDGYHIVRCPHCSGSGKLTESKIVLETIMDKAFDEFKDRFTPIAKDGYYEIDTIIDDFVVYLVENFDWYIERHGKNNGDMLPSFKEYVWLINKKYPNSKLVITDIGNGKISVAENGK
jgi:hypothetical protein